MRKPYVTAASEPEEIHQQMEETRASLTDKLEVLENKVTETVQDAASAVTDTVATVKDSVESTVGTVKDTVESTVDSVKEAFNLRKHVEENPWAMVGAAAALGFLGGFLTGSVGPRKNSSGRPLALPPRSTGAPPKAHHHRMQTNGAHAPAEPKGPSFFSQLLSALAPQIEGLKDQALAAVSEVVSDKFRDLQENVKPFIADTVDKMTAQFSGKPEEARTPSRPEYRTASPF